MNYRSEWAAKEGIDPRDELEKFVLSNKAHINRDQIKEAAPNLNTNDEDGWLREFVRTNNPYDVLQNCFYNLQELVEDELDNHELIDIMLEKFGFKKEVKPSGFSQMRVEIEQCLVDSELRQMDTAMQELLGKLFLFHSYTLNEYAVTKVQSADNTIAAEKADAIEELENLRQHYQVMPQAIGQYFQLMGRLMRLIQEDDELSSYYRRYFRREVPLNQNQIAELGMFALYRNIVSHPKPPLTIWEGERQKAIANLDKMDDTTRREWEGSWNHVVGVYESQRLFPPESVMVQRMSVFFRQFLDSLSEDQIYPKVIVMRSYTVDDYGTYKITAVDDAEETVFITDQRFEPFTEFYYHSRTNPTGIEPILVSKEELEDWATQSDNDAAN